MEVIDQLRRRVGGYVRARGDRQEESAALQASIEQAGREVANLGHRIQSDSPLRHVYRQLVCELNMAKGTLRQQTTTFR